MPKERRSKLNNKANRGILVGFQASNIYIIYTLENNRLKAFYNVLIKEGIKYDFDTKLKDITVPDFLDLDKVLEPDNLISKSTPIIS